MNTSEELRGLALKLGVSPRVYAYLATFTYPVIGEIYARCCFYGPASIQIG